MSQSIPETAYRIGGLLYAPAINTGLADKIAQGAYPCLTSMAFCLEDAIMDGALEQAEATLANTLKAIGERVERSNMPLLFVRVRTPEHLKHVHALLGNSRELLTGYILPKFDMLNAEEYAKTICMLNHGRTKPLYVMPIIESPAAAAKQTRTAELTSIHDVLTDIHRYVLNVRVGGNDFSNLYGLRRPIDRTIYDIGVIRDILTDIIGVFASDFVISGPVWEYFDSEGNSGAWEDGLRAELELDRLNGFIGKTAIHPSQLPAIYDSLRVSAEDYRDALNILSWGSSTSGVAKSEGGTRMNEVKCHIRWAQRIKILGDIYGIKEGITV